MKQNILVFCALCSFSVAAFGSANLTRDQVKHFDNSLAEQEKSQCLTQGPTTREIWLLAEMKKMGEAEPRIEALKREVWDSQILDFRIDGEKTVAFWIPNSLGTFGSVNNRAFQAISKDGQTLSANIIDAGKGTLGELNAVKNLSGSFWLVEKSDAIPDIAILSLEAKNRGAAGLVIYDGKNSVNTLASSFNSSEEPSSPFPMIKITADLAKKIREKIKVKSVQMDLSLKTDFPVVETGHAIMVKKGQRNEQAFLIINEDDCFAIGKSLAFFQWIKSGAVPVQGTTFVFFDHKSFSDNKFIEAWAHPVIQLSMTEAGESPADATKFLNKWFKSDENPDDVFDVKPILKKADAIQKDLKGLVSGEELKKYGDLLKQIEKPSKAQGIHEPVNYKLAQILGPQSFSGMVTDLKFLREAHSFAEKGQWDQAISAVRHVADFQWASNVSLDTFLSYEKQKAASGQMTANPAIWVQVQKGKQSVDVLIELLEQEIDRVDHQLSDNFFKLQKSIEEFRKI